MLQREHSAILSTFIKLQLSLRSLFLRSIFFSGRFTQVLPYFVNRADAYSDRQDELDLERKAKNTGTDGNWFSRPIIA